MPRFHLQSRRRRQGCRARALLLAASAAALLASSAAGAQQLGLRGEVPENVAAVQSRTAPGTAGKTGATPVPPNASDEPDDVTATLGITAPATDDSAFSDDPQPKPKQRRKPAYRFEASDDGARPKAAPKKTAGKPARTPARPAKQPQPDAAQDASMADADWEEAWKQPANRRAKTVDADERRPLDHGERRTDAIEGADPKREDDPFAAVGIRAGSFILRPALEQGITATSNADSSYDGSPAVLSETTLRLNALSDWQRHSASADGALTWRKTLSGQEIEDVRGRVDTMLRLDLGHDLGATARLGYEAAPESASSPGAVAGSVSQPLRQTFDGSLGLKKEAGKAQFGITGAVRHDAYGDAELSSGGTISQKDRDSTLYTATLRGGYEISPALTPFLEVEAGRRLYGQRVDNSGFERSATRFGARAGAELDLGEKLSGEFSAGWLREALDDDQLAPISGASVNADLKWSPERGTVVGLSGTTTVEGSTTAGESGSLLYSGRLLLERRIRHNLTGNAVLGIDWRDYVGSSGHDLTLSAEAGLTWWLSRDAGLTTRVRTEKLTSNLPGREETTNSVFLGLRLQR